MKRTMLTYMDEIVKEGILPDADVNTVKRAVCNSCFPEGVTNRAKKVDTVINKYSIEKKMDDALYMDNDGPIFSLVKLESPFNFHLPSFVDRFREVLDNLSESVPYYIYICTLPYGSFTFSWKDDNTMNIVLSISSLSYSPYPIQKFFCFNINRELKIYKTPTNTVTTSFPTACVEIPSEIWSSVFNDIFGHDILRLVMLKYSTCLADRCLWDTFILLSGDRYLMRHFMFSVYTMDRFRVRSLFITHQITRFMCKNYLCTQSL